MNIEQINDIVSKYNDLYELAYNKIELVSKIDSFYSINRGIERLSFEDKSIYVEYDDTCMGCYSTDSFYFPIEWLTLSDDELKQTVLKAKEERLEKERLAKEEKERKERLAKEEKERKDYLRLKNKYENHN